MKDIQSTYRFIAGDGAMDDSAWNAPHLAGPDQVFFAADGEFQFTLQ